MKNICTRFSRQAVIDRYFKKPHGYAAILGAILAAHSFFTGPRDFSFDGGGPVYITSKFLEPIFGGYSTAWLFLILAAMVIVDAETKFKKRQAPKQKSKLITKGEKCQKQHLP